jgi:hypothetical protein
MTRHRSCKLHIVGVMLIVASIVIAAGCGGGSSNSSSSTSTPSSSASSAPAAPTAAEKAADMSQAIAMTPTVADMPHGWADASKKSSHSHQCDIQKSDLVKTAETGNHMTSAFKMSDVNQFVGQAIMFHTLGDTEKAYQRYTSHETTACYARVLGKAAQEGAGSDATVGKPTIGEVSFPTVGDESKLFRVELPFTAQGIDLKLYVDLFFYRVGRGIAFDAGENLNQPFQQNIMLGVSRKLAARGKAAEPAG